MYFLREKMKRNTAELKERLIQTGIKEIEKHGIDQLSLRTVAKSCGVTQGTPYRHFESKENYLKGRFKAPLLLFSTKRSKKRSIGRLMHEINWPKWDLTSSSLRRITPISLKSSLLNFLLSI